MLQLKNISQSFINEAGKILVLNDISLTIAKGEFVVIIGANGSGKSTLLNAISGQIKIDSGQIIVDGNAIENLAEYERGRFIARVFQSATTGTVKDLTVMENMRLASLRNVSKTLKRGITNEFKKQVKDKIALLGLGLEDKTEQLMGNLSGGQRQALTLIMAILCDAKLLLMDEPTSALDPRAAKVLMQCADKIIAEFNLTTLMVTHSMNDAINFGSRLLLMKEGKIAKDIDANKKVELQTQQLYDWIND